MGILMYVYNIVALIVIFMGCVGIYESLKKWVRITDEDGKPKIMNWRTAERFDFIFIVLLIFLFYIICNRAGWFDGPLLHFNGDEYPYDELYDFHRYGV